jgi:integrase
MKAKLTDKFLISARCRPPAQGRVIIADTSVPGLTLRLCAPSTRAPEGLRQWFLRYRPRGQAQRARVLGHYPALPLAQARQRSRDILTAARKGLDLIAEEEREAEEQKAAEARRRTVRQVATDYLASVRDRLRSYRDIKSRLDNHILPKFGDRLIGELRRGEIVEFLDELRNAGMRHMVNRSRETLIQLFGFAVERGYADANPAAATKKFRGLEPPRERVLSRDETRSLWQALDRITEPGRSYVRVLMLTGCRREEARAMRWDELDLDAALWTLPISRNKGGRAHEIPLTAPVVAILRERERQRLLGPYVFSLDGKRPMAVHQIKARLDEESGIAEWRLHDLRRTLRTGLAELGIPYEIAERVIGHAVGGLERVYNVFAYRDEKRAALEKWAAHLRFVVGDARDAANVVPLKSAS